MTRSIATTTLLALLCWSDADGQSSRRLEKGHPKYRTANKVFTDMVRAFGDGRAKPVLRVNPNGVFSRFSVAWFNSTSNTLTIEQRAYDLCVSLGPDSLDAMASLIGHELAHYYKDHSWPGDFGNGFADLEVGQAIGMLRRDLARNVEIEAEADYFGGFFAHVAGYNSLGVAPELLAAVYREFEIAENPLYPSLAERVEIARRSDEKLRGLIPVFEAGNRLMLISRYEEAGRCFEFIARTFPSREILNNAGVALALEAISLFEDGELAFAYPFEVDPTTRLQQAQKASEHALDTGERRSMLLAEAAEFFEQARDKDRNYAPAYTNLACVSDLRGEFDEALFFAGKAVKISQKQNQPISLANALIARGIAQAHGDPPDDEEALADFEAATSGNRALAQVNINALAGESAPAPVAADGPAARREQGEKIGGLGADEYEVVMDDPDAARASIPKRSRSQPRIHVYARHTEQWQGLVVDARYGTMAFLETPPGYSGMSGRGVKVGQSVDELTEAYGPAAGIVAGARGAHFLFPASRIVFHADGEDKVRGWMTYFVEE